MIVSGLPERNGNLHVKEMAWVALNILKSVITFKIPHKPGRELQIRIGRETVIGFLTLVRMHSLITYMLCTLIHFHSGSLLDVRIQ